MLGFCFGTAFGAIIFAAVTSSLVQLFPGAWESGTDHSSV